jgi:hypothetical protein
MATARALVRVGKEIESGEHGLIPVAAESI